MQLVLVSDVKPALLKEAVNVNSELIYNFDPPFFCTFSVVMILAFVANISVTGSHYSQQLPFFYAFSY